MNQLIYVHYWPEKFTALFLRVTLNGTELRQWYEVTPSSATRLVEILRDRIAEEGSWDVLLPSGPDTHWMAWVPRWDTTPFITCRATAPFGAGQCDPA
jgi:hypothetical protein